MRFIDIYTYVYLFKLNSSSRVLSRLNVKVTHKYLVYAMDEDALNYAEREMKRGKRIKEKKRKKLCLGFAL